jgi:RHS repeat-associated protein
VTVSGRGPRRGGRDDDALVLGDGYVDELLCYDAGATRYYFHGNRLSSVYAITNSSGAVVERYFYTPYGLPTTYDASYNNPLSYSRVGNPFLFTGREWDAETGLYHFRARTFDPAEGRFKQRDPLGYVDGYNLFEYVSSAPTMLVDPHGTSSLFACAKVPWACAGIMAGGAAALERAIRSPTAREAFRRGLQMTEDAAAEAAFLAQRAQQACYTFASWFHYSRPGAWVDFLLKSLGVDLGRPAGGGRGNGGAGGAGNGSPNCGGGKCNPGRRAGPVPDVPEGGATPPAGNSGGATPPPESGTPGGAGLPPAGGGSGGAGKPPGPGGSSGAGGPPGAGGPRGGGGGARPSAGGSNGGTGLWNDRTKERYRQVVQELRRLEQMYEEAQRKGLNLELIEDLAYSIAQKRAELFKLLE